MKNPEATTWHVVLGYHHELGMCIEKKAELSFRYKYSMYPESPSMAAIPVTCTVPEATSQQGLQILDSNHFCSAVFQVQAVC